MIVSHKIGEFNTIAYVLSYNRERKRRTFNLLKIIVENPLNSAQEMDRTYKYQPINT